MLRSLLLRPGLLDRPQFIMCGNIYSEMYYIIREHVIKSTCDENVNQLTFGVGFGLLEFNVSLSQ